MRIKNSFILVPGVGSKTEQKIWERGATHWDHFLEEPVLNGSKGSRIQDFIEKARKNLDVGNAVFFGDKLPSGELWRMYRDFEESACFFDIETTGLDAKRNDVTTVSFYRAGESKTLVQGQDLTRDRLKQEFSESSILVSFNGKRFDQPFLEQNFDLSVENPHIDLMYTFKKLGYSGGLKSIEKELGVDRELEDIDGREAIRLWKQYQRGDDAALEKLVKYNQYDARNLQDLLEIAHQRLTSQIFGPYQ